MVIAIEDFNLGAFDLLTKPSDTEKSNTEIKKAFARKDEQEGWLRAAMLRDSISSLRSVLEGFLLLRCNACQKKC